MKTRRISFFILSLALSGLTCNFPTQTTNNLTVLATSEPPKLLAPHEFAATNQNLAATIGNLNRVELKFIQSAQAASPNAATLDDDLREIAARAMQVAQMADTLGRTMMAQDGGSAAALQTASQYSSIARLGYALVIEAQNARDGLPAGTIARADAVNVIAEYGARLWNSAITDPSASSGVIKGNPFVLLVKDAANIAPTQFLDSSAAAQLKPRNIVNWLATSQEVVTTTVNIPAPRTPVSNPFDSTLLNTLMTASGQSDSDRARQVAAANLAMLTANPTNAPTQIQFAVFKSASIADASQIAAGVVPSFANGRANALARRDAYAGGAEQLVGEMYMLNGQAPPRVEASTPVKETTPLVTLNIVGVKEISRRRDNQGNWGVAFQVQVAWQTTYTAPRLYIVCAGGSAGNMVTSKSGSQQLSAYAYVHSKNLPG